MRKTLLNPNDVARYTPVKLGFNPCTFRELYAIEYSEAVRCLGTDLWAAMTAALVDYSDATGYETGPTYGIGAVVIWRGGYRIATAETTQSPDFSGAWEDAPRFSDSTYEDLFCSFLAPYLSYVVLSQRLPYILTQITDQGMNYGGRQYNTQDKERIESLERAIYRDRERALQVLDNFMSADEAKDNAAFAGWKGYEVDDTDPCDCDKNTCNECSKRRPRHVGRYRIG